MFIIYIFDVYMQIHMRNTLVRICICICCAKNNAHLLNRLIAFLSQLLEDVTYPWYRSSPAGRAAVWGGM